MKQLSCHIRQLEIQTNDRNSDGTNKSNKLDKYYYFNKIK